MKNTDSRRNKTPNSAFWNWQKLHYFIVLPVSIWGVGSFFGGLSPPKSPRCYGTGHVIPTQLREIVEQCVRNVSPQHRRSQEGAKGAMPSPQFWENKVILCFERRFSRQNSVLRLKSNILAHPNFWAGYATGPQAKEWTWVKFCKLINASHQNSEPGFCAVWVPCR